MLHHTLERFRGCRKALQAARKANASKLEEADQALLRDLFNDLVGKDEKTMNTVTEDDIHATTEKVEREFVDASDKILDKYLKS